MGRRESDTEFARFRRARSPPGAEPRGPQPMAARGAEGGRGQTSHLRGGGAVLAARGRSATRLVEAALSPPTPGWPIRVQNSGGTASLPADQSTSVPLGPTGKADD